jgi:UDP-glucose 4-epimerase
VTPSSVPAALAGKRVLITGGAGFIGSNLAIRLTQLGAQVTVVDSLVRECGGNLYNLRPIDATVSVSVADVRDDRGLVELIQDKDILFNLAGRTSHLDSMQDPLADLDSNCATQLHILEACRRVNPEVRVVFASTRQLYGRPEHLPVDERHPLRPIDVNGINKMAGERYHLLYNEVYGMPTCALRLTNTYGPRMRVKDARQTFLGVWVRLVVEDDTFEVWGGGQLRDLTYIDDAIDALLRCGSDPAAVGQVFNLGGLEVVSLSELAQRLVAVAGSGSFELIAYPDERSKIDIGDYHADFAKISSTLGWMPTTDLEDGLARTVAYYRDHLEHYR